VARARSSSRQAATCWSCGAVAKRTGATAFRNNGYRPGRVWVWTSAAQRRWGQPPSVL